MTAHHHRFRHHLGPPLWGITPENLALSAHLEVADLAEWGTVLEAARAVLRERFDIDHVTLQPEQRSGGEPHTAIVRVWPRKKKQPQP